ncbi:MAG: FG-GAP repeat protein [Ignavibacteria bacterium]|nr:FG-GAP repeat protein [Ignavibacteria bacterium]
MKIQTKLYTITGMILILSFSVNVNLSNIKAETNISSDQNIKSQLNSDSLPEGLTEDWLNDLRDENGNKIINNLDNKTSGQIPEDPEGDSFQRKIFNGLNSGENFGISVSNAGDVNGDGYDDIIIGAPNYSSSTGRAYIYYGGLIMSTIANVILTGGTSNNYFGRSVSAAGDVNSDGYDDVIVGAYGYTSSTGRAYIYFGGSPMNNNADVTMTGETTFNLFGISVSSAGDVNADGFSDVFVGANGYNSSTGRAYIFLGGASMNNTADVTMTGEAANIKLGYSVSDAGDVNGDGYSDVIAGAYDYSSSTGRAYIYFGGASMNNIADVTVTGETAFSNFGQSVSAAGDVNGDGYSDVIAGAFGYNSSTGRSYIYFGGASMNNTADVTMTGEASGIQFGQSVSNAGDVNGDGYSDVIAGANVFSTFTGKTYIFFGGLSMDNIPDAAITGEAAGNQFGYSVSAAGDVNGDGYSDVIAGAWGYGTNTGRAYLYDYFMKGIIIPEIAITGEAVNNYLGHSVSSAGDVNGDGYSDVIVGANGYSSFTGRVYIYFGGEILNNVPDVTLTGEAAGIYFGYSVSGAGDVNGDGFSDVIVGADVYNSNTGRAYLYYGGASMNNVADGVMTGESANSYFGISVSTAGDVNGDGYSDWIVGAKGYSSSTGRAYLYYGSAFMNNVADVIMTGVTTINQFGISVSTAGDVNGDGYSDVIVGANGYNINTGRAYIFYGGSSMDNAADVTMTGETSGDSYGNSVACAGDVNGDGYSDVIAGAPYYNSLAGRAYIYFGNVSIDNTADVIITGESDNAIFGVSVKSAGDINGDGYSDVIVGAHNENAFTGRAYVFFGGIDINNIIDIAMSGEASSNSFGYSATSAGDVNGDGYSDIITGAYGYGTNAGRAYIYTGSAIEIKPVLNYVKDVPNDQGGKVNLKWTRSGYDVQGNTMITDYLIQRSFPPSGGSFSWQNIATIPASHESFYTYLDSTPSDSTSNGNSTFFYRITANTNYINQSWKSNILSGRSIDNIAPLMVSPFNAFTESVNVRLTWKRNSAPDLLNYVLFRNTAPSIDPYTETPLTSLTDSTYLDTSPLNGSYYYFIVAQDIHTNYSPIAVTQRPLVTLNLTMLIQGFYNSSTDLMVQDTARVYLRNSSSPYAIVDSAKAYLSNAGAGTFSFSKAVNGVSYYLQLKQRNSLETWSKTSHAFTGNALTYNFTTTNTQAYGNNMINVDVSPARFADYSGDVNQDGAIDLTDVLAVYNSANSFVNGYVTTDLTGNEIVDLTDVLMAYNNSVGFVRMIRP